MSVISTEGDLGDCAYLLAILKNLPGGPHTLLFQQSGATKASSREALEKMVGCFKPLADAQPYITECRIIEPNDKVWWASAGFRAQPYHYGKTLLAAHVSHLKNTRGTGDGITGADKWLTVDPSAESKGRVVVNRTGRYRNQRFPWAEVVRHYRHHLLFVGLHHEWREFIAYFGYVDFRPTGNLLEVAQLIAGSDLFIGNQSCAYACAEGLKHTSIQETSTQHPDCIFKRDNAQYVIDGKATFGEFDGVPSISTDPVKPPHTINTNRCPRDGWQFDGKKLSTSFHQALPMAMSMRPGMTKEQVTDEMLNQTADRLPEYFNRANPFKFGHARVAMRNAGL